MTVRDVVRSASIRVLGSDPGGLFSVENQTVRELRDLVQEAAEDIAASYDWRALTRIAMLVGDGVTDAFPIPNDYERMLVASHMHDEDRWLWGYRQYASVDDYMCALDGALDIAPPHGWIILGGEFRFQPAPSGTARFPYITSLIVRASDGSERPRFEADDDEFVLSERLLTLGLIWRYRAQKGLDYTEDMQTYELALAQAQSRDTGPQSIRSRTRRGVGIKACVTVTNLGHTSEGALTDYVAIYNGAQN